MTCSDLDLFEARIAAEARAVAALAEMAAPRRLPTRPERRAALAD